MPRKSKASTSGVSRANVPGAALQGEKPNVTISRAQSDVLVIDETHKAFSLSAKCTAITISPSDQLVPKGYPGANKGITFRSATAILAFLYACDQEYDAEATKISMAGVNLGNIDAVISDMLTTYASDDEESFDTDRWSDYQASRIKLVLELKFRPRAGCDLAKQLVATGNKTLVYAVNDRQLGIGYVDGSSGQFERIVQEREKWGANLVGKALMELRERFSRLSEAQLSPPHEIW